MGEYTQSFMVRAESLDADEESLLYENAKAFRGFDEAFIAFISEHGYAGELSDVKAMTKFVRTKFAERGVPALHNFRDLFHPNRGNTRETAFKICFALGLSIDETNDFFRRVMFERGIDCHSISEAVYYFGIKNGLSYGESRELLNKLPKVKNTKKVPQERVLYTDKIRDYIEQVSDKEKFIQYMIAHADRFGYQNATAIKFIRLLWNQVIGKENPEDDKERGLAFLEGRLIDEMLNLNEQELTNDDYVISREEASAWTIYCQIMGLDNHQEELHRKMRSLSPVFTDNVLLPLKAGDCFPSRQIIDGIIRGESDGDYEKFRKMLIFLAFYTYCAKKIIREKDIFYFFDKHESERCREHVNKYLVDAGYPELYYGNPYDWIFLWSMRDGHPLEIFRIYMREVYISKNEISK